MRGRFVLSVLLLLLVMQGTVVAQEEWEEHDIMEVCFYGGLGIPVGGVTEWGDSLGAETGWSLGFDLGYFLSSQWVLGFTFLYTEFSISDVEPLANSGHHHRLYDPNVYIKYYFPGEGNWSPYVKGHVGLNHVKFSTEYSFAEAGYREFSYGPGVAFGVGAGLFYYTSDFGGLFLEANYQYLMSKDIEKRFGGVTYVFGEDIGTVDIHAGIRVLIGPGE